MNVIVLMDMPTSNKVFFVPSHPQTSHKNKTKAFDYQSWHGIFQYVEKRIVILIVTLLTHVKLQE